MVGVRACIVSAARDGADRARPGGGRTPENVLVCRAASTWKVGASRVNPRECGPPSACSPGADHYARRCRSTPAIPITQVPNRVIPPGSGTEAGPPFDAAGNIVSDPGLSSASGFPYVINTGHLIVRKV